MFRYRRFGDFLYIVVKGRFVGFGLPSYVEKSPSLFATPEDNFSPFGSLKQGLRKEKSSSHYI
ncbi:hypothetical protein A2U01_0012948, partial [Trifolium medium]|nr:hypothetical protein [Trifolium medium]